jgi:hypothetical protein
MSVLTRYWTAQSPQHRLSTITRTRLTTRKSILGLSFSILLLGPVCALSQVTQTILETTYENPVQGYSHSPTNWSAKAAAPVVIKNHWRPDEYVNIESGLLAASPIQPGYLSARWNLEPVTAGSTIYRRIRNIWKPDQYLNIESGTLVAGSIEPGWLSAQWTVRPITPGSTLYRIQNVWKPDLYLNVESGTLAAGPIQPGWLSAMWAIEPIAFPWARDIVQGKTFAPQCQGTVKCGNSLLNHAKFEWTQALNPEQEYDIPLVGLSGRAIVLPYKDTVIRNGMSGSDNPFLHPFGNDWEFFVAPDTDYLNLIGPPKEANGEYVEAVAAAQSDFGLLPENMVGVESDHDLIPLPYRVQHGDRVAVWGRWIVDTGHADFHTEIHPPLLLATARAVSANSTTTTVIGRPYLVSQRFSDGPLFEHLEKEAGKVAINLPVFGSLRMEAHPRIMDKAFQGTLQVSYIVRPPTPRKSASDQLMVHFRFKMRTGVSVQLVDAGDAVTVNIVMNDQLYKRAALPRKENLTISRQTLSDADSGAGKAYLADEIFQGILSLGVDAIILNRGILTDRYDALIQPQNPDFGRFADLPVSALNDPINSSHGISIDNGQPFPIYGTLNLTWKRSAEASQPPRDARRTPPALEPTTSPPLPPIPHTPPNGPVRESGAVHGLAD